MSRDPIADMLTQVRNGLGRRKASVDVPASKMSCGVLGVLVAEGFIAGFDEIQDNRQGIVRIHLKYGPDGEQIVSHIRRESKPSRRVYKQVSEIPQVLGGLGIAIYSTPKGIVSDRQARQLNVGGELLCTIW